MFYLGAEKLPRGGAGGGGEEEGGGIAPGLPGETPAPPVGGPAEVAPAPGGVGCL